MWGFFTEIIKFFRDVFNWFIRKKKTIKEEIASAEKVNRLLDALIRDTGADRAYVFQFHNGDYFYTGNSIDKMTNTHESVRKGISREQISCMGMMVSPFRHLVSGMINSDMLEVPDVSKMNSYNSKILLSERGAMSSYMVVMRDNSGRPVGFVGIDFVKESRIANTYSKTLLKQASTSIYDLLVYGKVRT